MRTLTDRKGKAGSLWFPEEPELVVPSGASVPAEAAADFPPVFPGVVSPRGASRCVSAEVVLGAGEASRRPAPPSLVASGALAVWGGRSLGSRNLARFFAAVQKLEFQTKFRNCRNDLVDLEH